MVLRFAWVIETVFELKWYKLLLAKWGPTWVVEYWWVAGIDFASYWLGCSQRNTRPHQHYFVGNAPLCFQQLLNFPLRERCKKKLQQRRMIKEGSLLWFLWANSEVLRLCNFCYYCLCCFITLLCLHTSLDTMAPLRKSIGPVETLNFHFLTWWKKSLTAV